MEYWIGQGCGLLSALASMLLPFFRQKRHMLLDVLLINFLMMMNFILIGQLGSAVYLCAVAEGQTILSMVHERRGTAPGKGERLTFLALYVGFGLYGMISASGFVPAVSPAVLVELLPICGSVLSMLFVFARDERSGRKLLLATNCVWATYSAIVGASILLAQVISIGTTLAAMYRYRGCRRKVLV